MENCVFCKIASKIVPKELLYEDDEIVAFNDLLPKAPVHIQVIPKEHIASINAMEEKNELLVGKMFWVAKQLAKKFNIAESGYKLIFNVGKDGGMIIPHLHLHVLGGKSMPE